jgi:DnaJ-class molecular chaperone
VPWPFFSSNTGFIQKVEHAGMPVHQYPFEKGNLYIEYKVDLPIDLSLEQQEGKRQESRVLF